jgi:hypothetical protein
MMPIEGVQYFEDTYLGQMPGRGGSGSCHTHTQGCTVREVISRLNWGGGGLCRTTEK